MNLRTAVGRATRAVGPTRPSPPRMSASGLDEHTEASRRAQRADKWLVSGSLLIGTAAMNSAVFFLLGLYALLTTTHGWPTQGAMLDDYVTRTLRSIGASRVSDSSQ